MHSEWNTVNIMESPPPAVKSVAVIGAGAAGAIAAAALTAENVFDRIRVFERRETAGGTWIHDLHPDTATIVEPGKLPPELDPPLPIPTKLPAVTPPNKQNRWSITPIYNSLTTNVPHVAMCFSDALFPYGPFAPHYIARQYIENYFSIHATDKILEVNTTVEDLSQVPTVGQKQQSKWRLTLRKYDPTRMVDVWWEDTFDAVVLANGHYSVPYIPAVQGLSTYITKYPNRVSHSKTYRSPQLYRGKKVLIVGNSASGHDICMELASVAQQPVYLSRRSKAKWEGNEPPAGVVWKPTIKDFKEDGTVTFSDDTPLENVDAIIYCTGYKTSFPFWNEKANGRSLWDYSEDRLVGTYLHTFFQDFPTLGIVGLPRTLTFRSFEYQAIALARLWSNRNTLALPPPRLQKIWETEYAKKQRQRRQKFHDIPWENNETKEYLELLFQIAGLGTIDGDGRIPPPLTKEMVWALEHIQKYPSVSNKAPEIKETNNMLDSWLLL